MKISSLKASYGIVVYIGIAMIVSIFIFAGIVEWIKITNEPFNGYVKHFSTIGIVRRSLFSVSLLLFVITWFLKKAFYSQKIKSSRWIHSSRVFENFVLINVWMIIFALSEVICIYGLVLFLIAGNRFDFYLFFALSLTSYIINFPRFKNLQDWATVQ